MALFTLWLFLQILDRRLGDYRPFGDYWTHSVTWIALYLFIVGWEVFKLMTPSTSRVPIDWFLWVYLVLALIVDYSVWVVALGPGKPNDQLNWGVLDYATAMMALFLVILFTQRQGQSGTWRWLTTIFLLLASITSILVSHYGDFPASKKYRWIRWLAFGACAAGIFLNAFSRQMMDADDRVSGFFTGLLLVTITIGAVALTADAALRFGSGREHQGLDEINYRYRRRRWLLSLHL